MALKSNLAKNIFRVTAEFAGDVVSKLVCTLAVLFKCQPDAESVGFGVLFYSPGKERSSLCSINCLFDCHILAEQQEVLLIKCLSCWFCVLLLGFFVCFFLFFPLRMHYNHMQKYLKCQ